MQQRQTFMTFDEIEYSLQKEKTVLREPIEEETLLKRLCPTSPDTDIIGDYESELKLVQKFMKHLSTKIRGNQFGIVFDEPRARSGEWYNIVIDGPVFDVLLPIRADPATTDLIRVSPEYFALQCSGKDKHAKLSREVLESLWIENGTEWILCPTKVCKSIYTILRDLFQVSAMHIKEFINVASLSNDTNHKVLLIDAEFNKEYLSVGLAQKPRKSIITDDDHFVNELRPLDGETIGSLPEESTSPRPYDTRIQIRIIPSLSINVKDKVYLTASGPNNHIGVHHPNKLMNHVWFQDCWWKEQNLLGRICAADKGTRISIAAAILQLCRCDTELDWISAMHLRHNLLLHFDQMLDNVGSSWQRESFYECFYNQLECLREQLRHQKIGNFFNLQNSLIDQQFVNEDMIKRAVNRINILIKSRSSLIRCLNKTILKLYADDNCQ